MPRPKKVKDERGAIRSIRLTDEQLDQIKAAAKEDGLGWSTWSRMKLLAMAKRRTSAKR